MARTGNDSGRGGPAAAEVAPSPRARRLTGPKWLDLRLVIGVLLVLGSVLLGARVISASDASTTVWAARTDLAAGTPLSDSDLVQVKVQLYDSSARYLSTTDSLTGRTLVKDLAAGELVPQAALAESSGFVTFSLAVPAQRVPISLRRGQKVTIYASMTPADGPTVTAQVATGVAVVQISGRSDGALSVGSALLQVVLSVPSCQVAAIIDATEKKTVSLAVLPPSSSAAPEGCPDAADPSSGGAPSSSPASSATPSPAGPTS